MAPGGSRTADVDLACWFCASAFDREQVERDALLVPRRTRDGGPFLRFECPACARPSNVERNRAGALLASPPPIVPVADALLATFDPDLRRELNAKREHERRRAGRREWFMGAYADELVARGWRPGERRPPPEPAPGQDAPREPGPGPEPRRQQKRAERPRERRSPTPPPPPPQPPPPEPEPAPAEPLPHELLGIAPDAPPEVVNGAFRELAKRYHPDRFAALDDEFQVLANRRMQQLMAAREALLRPPG